MNIFPKIILSALAFMALLVCLQSCKEDKKEAVPCPKCYDLRSTCVEGVCECEEGFYQVNNVNWCVGPGQFMAAFDDWYCLDTVALTVGPDIYYQASGQVLSRWANKDDPNASNWSPMYIVNEPNEHYIMYGGFLPTLAEYPGRHGYCDTLGRSYFLDFYGELVHPDTIIGHFIARSIDYTGEGVFRDTLIVPMYMLK